MQYHGGRQHANKEKALILILILAAHPEYLLNFQDAFHKDGPQLVSNARQQKAKERDAKYGIKNAKDFPALCSRSYVSITCQKTKTHKEEKISGKEKQ